MPRMRADKAGRGWSCDGGRDSCARRVFADNCRVLLREPRDGDERSMSVLGSEVGAVRGGAGLIGCEVAVNG